MSELCLSFFISIYHKKKLKHSGIYNEVWKKVILSKKQNKKTYNDRYDLEDNFILTYIDNTEYTQHLTGSISNTMNDSNT